MPVMGDKATVVSVIAPERSGLFSKNAKCKFWSILWRVLLIRNWKFPVLVNFKESTNYIKSVMMY